MLGIFAAFTFTCILFMASKHLQDFLKLSLPLAGLLWGGLYLSARIVGDFHAMALQSRSDLNPFFYLVPIQAVVSILLQWSCCRLWGPVGILMGLTLSYLCTVCWALPRRLYKLKQRSYV